MPMTFLRAGETGMIQRVGGAEDTKRFLANLGFVDGAAVTVISELNGNLIVNITRRWQSTLWCSSCEKRR